VAAWANVIGAMRTTLGEEFSDNFAACLEFRAAPEERVQRSRGPTFCPPENWLFLMPENASECYADEATCHCRCESEARQLQSASVARLAEYELEQHPYKTRIT
jgi:hypothetical protein